MGDASMPPPSENPFPAAGRREVEKGQMLGGTWDKRGGRAGRCACHVMPCHVCSLPCLALPRMHACWVK